MFALEEDGDASLLFEAFLNISLELEGAFSFLKRLIEDWGFEQWDVHF